MSKRIGEGERTVWVARKFLVDPVLNPPPRFCPNDGSKLTRNGDGKFSRESRKLNFYSCDRCEYCETPAGEKFGMNE